MTAVLVPPPRQRPEMVQNSGKRVHDIPRRRLESLAVFLTLTTAYAVLGYWLIVDLHVVGFEVLDRFNRALMIFHNDPAKLSAVGFDHAPLVTLAITPLTVSGTVAKSLVLVPLGSAVFAGLIAVVLNTMMRRAEIAGPLRVAVLVALALNPMFAFYGSNGAHALLWLAPVVVAFGALLAWYVTADIRFVMIAGLAFSAAALTGYSSLLWLCLSLVMIIVVLAHAGADGKEVEGTTVGFSSPTTYVVALWCVFNALLLGSPIAWITERNSGVGQMGGDQSAGELARATWDLVLSAAPLALVVLPALLVAAVLTRNGFSAWLGLALVLAVAAPAASAALDLTDNPMAMRDGLPMLVFSVIGAIWLVRVLPGGGALVTGGLILGLVVSIPLTFRAMSDYPHQSLEAQFADAIRTQDSQEGAISADGRVVGIVDELAMATYIEDHVTEHGSVLTDNSNTFAVILLTGEPELFFDRVDHGDGAWHDAADAPPDTVDYLLLSTNVAKDLLSQRFADAVDGTDPRLDTVYATERYVLVGVPADFTTTKQTEGHDPNRDDTPLDLTSGGE
ncbi:hypothetical protein [Nocardioides pacificus]